MDPLSFWRQADAPDRQGMTEIHYVEGHYAMWDELLARHPGLSIDNCASGGRRIDLETCHRSVPLWHSDTGCGPGHADWNQTQSSGLNLYVPVFTGCAWTPAAYDTRSAATAGLICQFACLDTQFLCRQVPRRTGGDQGEPEILVWRFLSPDPMRPWLRGLHRLSISPRRS